MLRRKAIQGSTHVHKRTRKDSDVATLGDYKKDVTESLLEEEVLGVGEDVVEYLTSKQTEPSAKKKKRRKRLNKEEPTKKWEDSDDEHALEHDTVNPSWAGTFDDEKSDDSDEEALKTHSYLGIAPSASLPSSSLDFKRVTDANKEDPSKSSLQSVEFHPKATVLLTGGPDCTIRLFAIDGSKNRKIHSVFFERTPVWTTHFNQAGTEIYIGSKHRSFYIYDMEGSNGVTFRPKIKGLEISSMAKFSVSPDGRFIAFLGGQGGYIHLFSQTSKELIDSVKMNGDVTSISFSKDGRYMYSFGSEGKVYVWDMNTRDCIHHFNDDGCIQGTSVAASPDNNYLVCGSKSGIVNIYDRDTALNSRYPKPVKIIKNLTTSCSETLFNPSSEILALRSKKLEKSVKLVHFPSMTVMQNFPEQFDTDQKMLTCMDFSPSSGYFAVGNNKGRCLLYRLEHYTKY